MPKALNASNLNISPLNVLRPGSSLAGTSLVALRLPASEGGVRPWLIRPRSLFSNKLARDRLCVAKKVGSTPSAAIRCGLAKQHAAAMTSDRHRKPYLRRFISIPYENIDLFLAPVFRKVLYQRSADSESDCTSSTIRPECSRAADGIVSGTAPCSHAVDRGTAVC